ncbi:hypothetical protein ACF07Y_39125 [Streptomyces sp. NPDC016566]|uniref:hypothetical protein n=1 Tax=Streptomyces sp. NPDC016566 TaxID=3364967 RepID=UPI0036FD1191
MAQGFVAALFAASVVITGPSAPRAQAVPDSLNPCNLPGGKYVCDKAEKGTKWLYDNSGADTLVDGISETVDFSTDPLGYIANHMRGGSQALFNSFGEALTGKKVNPHPKSTPKIAGGN